MPLTAWRARLRLAAIRDRLDSLLDEAARKELTLRQAAGFLSEREISRREDRCIEMALPHAARAGLVRFRRPASIDPGRFARRRAA